MHSSALTFLLLLSSTTLAFQLPFSLPFLHPQNHSLAAPQSTKIAIIGAGAAGTSAAFWISKAKERFGIEVEVDVYDRESYIGGRSTVVYPYNDTSFQPIELGASIFVKANKNLWRASDEFGLTRIDFEGDESDTGIWDGEKLLLTMTGGSFWSEWWATVKMLWRYGYNAPVKTRGIVSTMIKKFVTLYTPQSPTWENISSLSTAFNWDGMLAQTTSEYLDTHEISRKFTAEIVEAATRVNYGQNVDEIHALEGLCSLATTGASSIEGGNFQIFEHFLNSSGARQILGANVKGISRPSAKTDHWVLTSDRGSEEYKAVIIAAPFHATGITVHPAVQVPKQPYVHLHVTLLTTTAPHPDPAYFSLSSAPSPTTILTTYNGVRQGGKEPEFNSLTYHGLVKSSKEDVPPEWSVKIFSKERISDAWLARVFQNQVGWVHRKEWDAYPKLPPTIDFPPIKLDDGLYYVNAFEPFISTMETETIASRNVVDLLLHEGFASGICGPRISVHEELQEILGAETPSEDFVLGWDC